LHIFGTYLVGWGLILGLMINTEYNINFSVWENLHWLNQTNLKLYELKLFASCYFAAPLSAHLVAKLEVQFPFCDNDF